jgi:hypothetical protein
VDWDWEDRPPSDSPPPRRAADEPGPAEDPRPPERERPRPEHLEPEPLDESVTQVFSADAAWDLTRESGPVESAPPSPPREYVLPDRTETGRLAAQSGAEFERPSLRTIEVAERAAVGGARRSDHGEERRARSPQERAARREQRRRQLRRRRLVALAILVAIVVLIVVLVVRGCGGGSGASALVFGMVLIDRRLLAAPERR